MSQCMTVHGQALELGLSLTTKVNPTKWKTLLSLSQMLPLLLVFSLRPGAHTHQEHVLRRATTHVMDIKSPFEANAQTANTQIRHKFTTINENTVDQVLDEVRPMLLADGGNVKVVKVDSDTKNVYVAMQGACGSCPSAAVTLKNGIERVLKERFLNIGEIIAVEDQDQAQTSTHSEPQLSIDAINDALSPLMAAITGLGGQVAVEGVDSASATVSLRYSGPEKLKFGISLALEDDPRVSRVQYVN